MKTLFNSTAWKAPKIVDLPKSRYRVIERPKLDTRAVVTIAGIVIVSIAWALLV
jgi:hypothetical protein